MYYIIGRGLHEMINVKINAGRVASIINKYVMAVLICYGSVNMLWQC